MDLNSSPLSSNTLNYSYAEDSLKMNSDFEHKINHFTFQQIEVYLQTQVRKLNKQFQLITNNFIILFIYF